MREVSPRSASLLFHARDINPLLGVRGDMRAAFRSENIGTAELNHVVLQVQGYDLNCEEESESEGYPGLIKGRAMGGALDGKPISVSLRKTLTNQNVLKVADLTDQHHLSHTPIGGYVALEGVRLAGTSI